MNLFEAVLEGSVQKVKEVIDKGALLTHRNDDGLTPLLLALKESNLEIVKYLMENGCNYEDNYIDEFSPISKVEGKNWIPIVKYFIDKGYSAENATKDGQSILHLELENVEHVHWILDNNIIDLENTNENGDTPLIVASYYGFFESFKLLLDRGANVYAKNNYGDTIATRAAYGGQLEIIQFIGDNIEELLDVPGFYDYPIGLACYSGHNHIVEYLLNRGVNVNSKTDAGGYTPIHRAVSIGNAQIVQLLLESNQIDFTLESNKELVLRATEEDKLEVLKILDDIDNNLIHEEIGPDKLTIMHTAAADNRVSILQWGLEKNLDISKPNGNGDTPLLVASYHGSIEALEWLLSNGASLKERNNYDDTALIRAAYSGNIKAVKWLLDHGCNLEDKNTFGDTPLLLAAYNGNLKLVEFLIDSGSNIDAQRFDGDNALLMAANNKQLPVMFYLILNGISIEHTNEIGEDIFKIAEDGGFLDELQNEIRIRTTKRANKS